MKITCNFKSANILFCVQISLITSNFYLLRWKYACLLNIALYSMFAKMFRLQNRSISMYFSFEFYQQAHVESSVINLKLKLV